MKTTSKANGNRESLNVRGRQKERNQFKNKGKVISKSRTQGEKWWNNLRCFHCQEMGHTKKFCPKKGKKVKEQDELRGEVAVVQDGYESSNLLVVSTSESNRKWILDSGYSFRMTPNKDWFETFKSVKGGKVLLGNNKSCEAMGIGIVRIKMHDSVERILQQVKYIPGLKRNLVSLGTLDGKG